jgi:RHH-type transcriptional regulator, proline utilization regulon repressor / proline dehydrogenase / delta 1-pyrroline-5-carboxylate dehydrogenase
MLKHSSSLSKAKNILNSVSGTPITIQQRRDLAIELAACILEEARIIQTKPEKENQEQLSRMLNDPMGRVFITALTDRCFRSKFSGRVADEIDFIIDKFGIPKFLSWGKKIQLKGFRLFGKLLSEMMVSLTKHMLRKETATVILPGEDEELAKHIEKRKSAGVKVNLNHLGEAILGEEEANHRLKIYLADLAKKDIEYISVKISTICSQLNLLAWDETLEILSHRLQQLFRVAKANKYTQENGSFISKFVNLDMEEYRDLHLTVELFQKVLEEPEFFDYSAGIVLQSYLPDAWVIQQRLTTWAMERVSRGGAPIKIRIVKGANLAMERVESSIRSWEQAPYLEKSEVDANFKRMVTYGSQFDRANAVHLGIASHNMFDVSYAMLLRAENNAEPYICFEMLEGMADHMRRVVQQLSGDMVLYCPSATNAEFQNAVAYLVRRLDENTAPQNFLRYAFNLVPGTKIWNAQALLFSEACTSAASVSCTPRRTQNRFHNPIKNDFSSPFCNEPDTDWSLPQNRQWAQKIIETWKLNKVEKIPLVIGAKHFFEGDRNGIGEDPSHPGKTYYEYTLANSENLEMALNTAQHAKNLWSNTSPETRASFMMEIAYQLRIHRADLIGAMIADTGKTVPEADVEVSEAIDFAEYYGRNLLEFVSMQDLQWKPKGVVLVVPPWNFPCSIPAGGILAAIAAGNVVIFKPAPEAVLVGWKLSEIIWKAGISKEVMQFINCEDEPEGSKIIRDVRINSIVLTGATETAKHFLKLRPGIDLFAETGGKNAIIVSALADRDLAIRDIIQSGFGHAGQKCSACSLVILEAEVYDDLHFRKQLRDAAASLKVGLAWELSTRLNPLIRIPSPTLMRGLTSLDEGEEWLLEPSQDPSNANLWSPGIKIGVQRGSFSHQTELFGPVLSVMRADNLDMAILLANDTPYGLTSGLHSLDEREQDIWMSRIEAGNCYINRGITGAIVQRQPFGGCKESSFGMGLKAGGPNYLIQLMHSEQVELPNLLEPLSEELSDLNIIVEPYLNNPKNKELWTASIGSYAYFWNHYFCQDHDPTRLLGQDNILRYVTHDKLVLRLQKGNEPLDLCRVVAGAIVCGAYLEISYDVDENEDLIKKLNFDGLIHIDNETEAEFIARIENEEIHRIRILSEPSQELLQAFANASCNIIKRPVMANGRVELLCYLREVIFSIDYHRYGYLGIREEEPRGTNFPGSDNCCGNGG